MRVIVRLVPRHNERCAQVDVKEQGGYARGSVCFEEMRFLSTECGSLRGLGLWSMPTYRHLRVAPGGLGPCHAYGGML